MASTSAETSLDKQHWLVVSICLHSVVTPPLREIIANQVITVYDLMKRKSQIDTQTYSNYSIDSNNLLGLENPDKFDYEVGGAVSFAKPFMAKFTTFDDSFDASAALAVLSYEGLFRPQVTKSAKSVNLNVRTEWAHPNFTRWTEKHYNDCFSFLEDLISKISVKHSKWVAKRHILHRLQWWKKHGMLLCKKYSCSIDKTTYAPSCQSISS